jgi:hypothetical protein
MLAHGGGGADSTRRISARRRRASRPGFDDLPWASFDASRCAPDDPGLLEARHVWTNGVFTEYASAAAFSALNLALLHVGAARPVMSLDVTGLGQVAIIGVGDSGAAAHGILDILAEGQRC